MTFILLLLFSYYGFGLFLISRIKIKFSIIERLVFSFALSISILSSLIALFGQLIGPNSYYFLVIAGLLGLSEYKNIFKDLILIWNKILSNKVASIFFLVTGLIFSSTLIFSGKLNDSSMRFQEVHDSVWHISLIQNLQYSIPPVHPSSEDTILTNYHYFYDIFLAGFDKFSTIPVFILYYQFSVLFLSFFIILSAYVLGNKIGGKWIGYYLSGFTIFVGSFAYLIPYFNPGQTWHESSFWVSQTLVMIVNPQIIFTIAITHLFIYLLLVLINKDFNSKDYYKFHGMIILLTATSLGFKSYSWVILTTVYAFYLLVEVIKYKSFKTFKIGLLYIFVSLPIVWLITRFNNSSFFYEPFWFTNSMIESSDRVNYLEWKFLQDHYLFKKNWIRFYEIEIKKILIFYLGNLGIRSIFLLTPIIFFFNKNKKTDNFSLYLLFGFLFSSIFPLLFLQKGTVWNSIQFWYYALIFANVLAVKFIVKILKNKSKKIAIIFTLIIFLLAIPTSIKTILDKNKTPFKLGNEEANYLKSLSDKDYILICPDDSVFFQTSLVNSLTDAKVYLANVEQLKLVEESLSASENYEYIFEKQDIIELQKIIENKKATRLVCSDTNLSNKVSNMLKINYQSFGSLNVFNL